MMLPRKKNPHRAASRHTGDKPPQNHVHQNQTRQNHTRQNRAKQNLAQDLAQNLVLRPAVVVAHIQNPVVRAND
jgi:hypothetical protein